MSLFTLLSQLLACSSPPDFVVDHDTTGTATRCLVSKVESIQVRGVSSPSVNIINTRALAKTSGGKTVQWDYMRSLREDARLAVGDDVYLLVGADGRPAGMARTCPTGLTADE